MTFNFLDSAKQTFAIEQHALNHIANQLDDSFARACEILQNTQGRVVVTGMGKSGHIGRKIAATFASTGTPAFFMHPGEASHGDLGMLTAQDVVVALSHSGESSEIALLLPLMKRLGVPIISLTGKAESTLARAATVHLYAGVTQEACPLNLAPTASTTVALVLGDALAVALLSARGFTAEKFAFSHPSGALGKRLLVRVLDIMHKQTSDLPTVFPDTPLRAALLEMSAKRLGMTCIVDENQRLLGIFTDGDLRRLLDQDQNWAELKIGDVMHTAPKTIAPNALAAEAVQKMQAHQISALAVVDANHRLVGALNMHDLLRAGVV